MRYRSLHKWDDKEGSTGLIYVAQLIDELLFDYTLDTYKPSAMNSSLLIREALTTIRAIDSGSIKKPNLQHILKELCTNLKRDDVAKSLIKVDINGVLATLLNPKTTEHAITTTIELLLNQVPIKVYKDKVEKLLIEEVSSDNDISKLRALTRSYITTLLNYGYSPKYIQDQSRSFFFYSKDRISNSEAISNYIDLFKMETREFKAIYRVPVYLKEFAKSSDKLGISVELELVDFEEILKRHRFTLGANEVYVVVENIKSKEPYYAKEVSDRRVDLFQTLAGLYHHKESPDQNIECLIYDVELNESIKVTKSLNPMHKCSDLKPGPASKKLAEFMSGFKMRTDSFRKFNRCAELHALALRSESKENQMINLWIALESLIPNKSEEEKISQIEHLISSMQPFLNIGYINKIILHFSKDLWNWDSRLIKRIMKQVVGDGYTVKMACFLSLDKYESLRNELESSFKDYHLLRDRYNYMRYLLTTPDNLVKALDNHTIRIEWQIRRIYRARNLIVHDGKTPSYTNVLIENTHDYLDCIMNMLMNLSATDNTLNSIDQGFKLVELNYSSYYKKLSEKNLSFTDGNINDLLFSY